MQFTMMSCVSLLVMAVIMVRSVMGDNDVWSTWSSITGSCEHYCYDGSVGNPWDLCTYETWKYDGGPLWKQCKCHCKWDTWELAKLKVPKVESSNWVDGVDVVKYKIEDGSYESNYGNNCGPDHKATDLPFQNGICTDVNRPCCHNGSCSGNRGDCEQEDSFDWSKTNKYCVMDSLLKPLDSCDLSGPIQKVTSNVDDNAAWDIGKKIAEFAIGSIPGYGSAFNLIISCMEPYLSDGSDPNDAMNGVIDAINKRLDELHNCMDQTITQNNIDNFQMDFHGVIVQAFKCGRMQAKLPNRINCNGQVFNNILAFMPKLKNYRDNVIKNKNFQNDLAAAYLSLLPQFDVIVHTYIAAATGAIEAQNWVIKKGCGDNPDCTIEKLRCDRDNELDSARRYIDYLIKWAHDAQNAIIENTRPKAHIDDDCTYNYEDINASPWYFNWKYDCGGITATRVSHTDAQCKTNDPQNWQPCKDWYVTDHCDGSRQQRVWAKLDMGKQSDGNVKTCEFAVRGGWACDKNKVFDVLKKQGQILIDNVNERLDKEWAPQFWNKYTTVLRLARVSLWNMEWASAGAPSKSGLCGWEPYKKVEVNEMLKEDMDEMLVRFQAIETFKRSGLVRQAAMRNGGGQAITSVEVATPDSTPIPINPLPKICTGLWKQCGGKGYYGPTACCGDKVCVPETPSYFNCQPKFLAAAKRMTAVRESANFSFGSASAADPADRDESMPENAERGVIESSLRANYSWRRVLLLAAVAGVFACVGSLGFAHYRKKHADYSPVEGSLLAV